MSTFWETTGERPADRRRKGGITVELKRLTGRIFYCPHQPEFDRPLLAYLRGDRFSLAIDAGYSAKHVDEFYAALGRAELKKPDFTVITHWHYDHTFGMHRIHGVSAALKKTNAFLMEQRRKSADSGYLDALRQADIHFEREYRNQGDLKIVLADITFRETLRLDLGGSTALAFHTESPHSEDTVCVYVPEEKVLFLGDATSEDFFNERPMDREKLGKLTGVIEKTDCELCVLSHTEPLRKAELLHYLHTVLGA